MKLTKKQRNRIYWDVLLKIDGHGATHLCPKLADLAKPLLGVRPDSTKDVPKLFPEFALFKQNTYVWFEYTGDNEPDDERIICMLLCYEMCKP